MSNRGPGWCWHRWTKWQDGRLTDADTGGVDALIQVRTCEKCGKAKSRTYLTCPG